MAANNIYSHMTFPDYVYREFPKWVTPQDGSQPVLCQDGDAEWAVLNDRPAPSRDQVMAQADRIAELEAELARLRGGNVADSDPVDGTHGVVLDPVDESERARLFSLADQRGIVVDRRWGLKRLREAMGT